MHQHMLTPKQHGFSKDTQVVNFQAFRTVCCNRPLSNYMTNLNVNSNNNLTSIAEVIPETLEYQVLTNGAYCHGDDTTFNVCGWVHTYYNFGSLTTAS